MIVVLLGSLAAPHVRAQNPSMPVAASLGPATGTIEDGPSGRRNAPEEIARSVATLTPWWNEQVKLPLDPSRAPLAMDLQASVFGVLNYSPQVRIAADAPVIRETQIVDAMARFDPRAFMDSKFVDTSDPVGNLLTTGGASRFIDQTVYSSGGLRQTNTLGGQFEAAQKLGFQDNNSRFFIPPNQGTARMTLTYTQPLLNGSGRVYNTSMICLAELNTQAASAQLLQDLQGILMETHRAYWDLRLQRAALLQRIRLKQSAIDIQTELKARAEFDVAQSQIVRANAAVATRDAAVIRFTTSVANAETKLRALINDPMLNAQPLELLPTMAPYHEATEPNLAEALTIALQRRPEVQQGFTEVRVASVKADVSKNELLPVFNLLIGSYVYGLQGDSQIGDAWVSQFNQGRPTYWTGLQFEYPLHNRGANARMTQRRVELRQATNKLQQTMVQVRAETEVAVREVTTTYREMVSKFQAMQADQTEIEYLTSRWRLASDDQQLAGVVLNDLLGAQERLAAAEFGFAAAEAAYNVALANLNAVTGTLLQVEGVRLYNTFMEGIPTLDVTAERLSAVGRPTAEPPEAVPQVSTPQPTNGGSAGPTFPHSQPAPSFEPPASVPLSSFGSQAQHSAPMESTARLLPPTFPASPPAITPLPPVAERDSSGNYR